MWLLEELGQGLTRVGLIRTQHIPTLTPPGLGGQRGGGAAGAAMDVRTLQHTGVHRSYNTNIKGGEVTFLSSNQGRTPTTLTRCL